MNERQLPGKVTLELMRRMSRLGPSMKRVRLRSKRHCAQMIRAQTMSPIRDTLHSVCLLRRHASVKPSFCKNSLDEVIREPRFTLHIQEWANVGLPL